MSIAHSQERKKRMSKQTPLQQYLKKNKPKTMDLDSFGAIMDDFITENECQMLITFPAKSSEPVIRDNMGLGAVLEFYFILKAIRPVFNNLIEQLGDQIEIDVQGLVDMMLKLVRDELIDEGGNA